MKKNENFRKPKFSQNYKNLVLQSIKFSKFTKIEYQII